MTAEAPPARPFERYADAWQLTDDAARLDALLAACTEDVTFTCPALLGVGPVEVHGVRDLTAFIGSTFEHWYSRETSVSADFGKSAEFSWIIVSQDGSTLAQGIDECTVDDRRRLAGIVVQPGRGRTVGPQEQPELSQFSGSVARAVGRLVEEPVRASTIVRELLKDHTEYAGDRAASLDLQPTQELRPVDDWLHSVRALYDTTRVKTVNGRYTIYGLSLLDPDLGRQLTASGFLEALEQEIVDRDSRASQQQTTSLMVLLSAEGRQRRRSRSVQSDTLGNLRDLPAVQRQQDQLDRTAFARALAERLRRVEPDRQGPFILHLYGPWGSGKTSLLNLLREELTSGDPPFLVVEFNAWRHQRAGSPWWWLLRTVYAQIQRQLHGWRAIKLWISEHFWRLWFLWGPSLIATAVLLLLLGAAWLVLSSGLLGQTLQVSLLKDVIQAVGALVTVVGAIFILARGFSRQLLTDAIQSGVFTRDPFEALRRHFSHFARRFRGRLVIFIDDLDRCQSVYVVELLEGIQTLFTDAPVTYVIAGDRHWLRSAFEEVYKSYVDDINQPGRPLGYLFLDKAFQLSAPVPYLSMQAQQAYWDRLLALDPRAAELSSKEIDDQATDLAQHVGTGSDARATQAKLDDPRLRRAFAAKAVEKLATPEAEQRTEHLLRPFASLLEPNPRAMKRLVNAYGVREAADLLAGGYSEPKELARWTIVELRWPLLAEYLEQRPEALALMGGDAEALATVPEHIRPLFSDAAVHAVVSPGEIGGELTAEAIRRCVGRPPERANSAARSQTGGERPDDVVG